jgi:hypothetical protein
MSQVRIIGHTSSNGNKSYEIQKKVFGLIWLNVHNIDAYTTGFFDTYKEAHDFLYR